MEDTARLWGILLEEAEAFLDGIENGPQAPPELGSFYEFGLELRSTLKWTEDPHLHGFDEIRVCEDDVRHRQNTLHQERQRGSDVRGWNPRTPSLRIQAAQPTLP